MGRAASVTGPRSGLGLIEVDPPPPPDGHVRIDVVASGMCGADRGTVGSKDSPYGFPLTPGHEVAGVVACVGEGVTAWGVGDRVAVGWFGGSCGHCPSCRRGDVVHCPDRKVPGISYPGGWADTLTAPADALARVPDGLELTEAAPFGCAGVTTFNALRNAGLRPASRVAIFGLGGLGHLAVQFASRMGHETIAIARGVDRRAAALELGASTYIDAGAGSSGSALARMGGADIIVHTAASTDAAAELLDGLAVGGQLTLIGVDAGTLQVPVARLVMRSQKVAGHLTGSPRDIEEAMAFAVTHDVRVVEETFPLDRADAAFDRLASGRARFRIVLRTR